MENRHGNPTSYYSSNFVFRITMTDGLFTTEIDDSDE